MTRTTIQKTTKRMTKKNDPVHGKPIFAPHHACPLLSQFKSNTLYKISAAIIIMGFWGFGVLGFFEVFIPYFKKILMLT